MNRRTKKFLRKAVHAIRHLFLDLFRPTTRTVRQLRYLGATLVVFSNEDIGWHLLTDRSFEERDIRALESLIRPDDICVDVGGNIGLYALFMARRASQGRVFSFEPLAINAKMIALNAALNDLANIHIIPSLVSNTTGTEKLSVSEDGAYSSMVSTSRKRHVHSIQCPCVTIDDFNADNGGRIDIIKIDVEGAELLVLEGARKLLSSSNGKPRAMLVEAHPRNTVSFGYTPGDLIRFVETFGYVACSITANGIEAGWSVEESDENILFVDARIERSLGITA